MKKIIQRKVHYGFYELNVLATNKDGIEQKVTIEKGCGPDGKQWQTNITKSLFKTKKDGVDFIKSIFIVGSNEFDEWILKFV